MTISMRIFIIYQGFSFFNISQIWGKGNWMWWVVLFTVQQYLSDIWHCVFQTCHLLATVIYGGTDVNLWSWPGWFTKWSLVVSWSFMKGGNIDWCWCSQIFLTYLSLVDSWQLSHKYAGNVDWCQCSCILMAWECCSLVDSSRNVISHIGHDLPARKIDATTEM